jgi:hypothetical protein
MTQSTPMPTDRLENPTSAALQSYSTEELTQAVVERLSITNSDWHKLKGNRKARAKEQAATALMLLLKDQPEAALERLQQATGWLDGSISAPPCPTHGHHQAK